MFFEKCCQLPQRRLRDLIEAAEMRPELFRSGIRLVVLLHILHRNPVFLPSEGLLESGVDLVLLSHMHMIVIPPDRHMAFLDQLLFRQIDRIRLHPRAFVGAVKPGRFMGDQEIDPLRGRLPDHIHGGHKGTADLLHFHVRLPGDQDITGLPVRYGCAGLLFYLLYHFFYCHVLLHPEVSQLPG